MRIEPGILVSIGWAAPHLYFFGFNKDIGKVGEVIAKEYDESICYGCGQRNRWWVVSIDEDYLYCECVLIPIPPDEETRDRETEKEEELV